MNTNATNAHTTEALRAALADYKAKKSNTRSAWDRGVIAQAEDFLDGLEEFGDAPEVVPGDIAEFKARLLNGADDWKHASWGGSGLIYDSEIAARYCSASELKRTKGGERKPNSREEWLDVQARGMKQAAALLCELFREIYA